MAEPDGITLRELAAIMAERQLANNQRFNAQEKAVAAALAAAKEAVVKAEAAAEKRFESVNEFRQQLNDNQARLMTKDEAALRFLPLEERLKLLETHQIQMTSETAGKGWVWGVLGVVGGLAIGMSGLLFAVLRP